MKPSLLYNPPTIGLVQWSVVILTALTLASPARALDLFVSPLGSDSNPGTRANPLATLRQAQKLARSSAGKETVHVLLQSGKYYLKGPLIFRPEDSGTASAPVSYAALPGAQVVISGGRRLDLDWKPGGKGMLSAPASDEIDQLFVDGQRRHLARWPDYKGGAHGVDVGYSKGLTPKEGKPASEVRPPLQPYSGCSYDPKRFSPRKWRHPEQAVLHVFQSHRWGNMQWRLLEIDYDQHLIELGEGGWQIGTLWFETRANWFKASSEFYIENVLEELDAPGEWFHDRQQGLLHYMPLDGENIAEANVVSCGLKELIVFQGSARHPVQHITLSGLSFRHTARTLLDPSETRLRGDWAIARRAAVRFDGAEHCAVKDCEFVGLGGNAVLLNNYNRKVAVTDSLFTDIGDSAVLVVGSDDAVRELRVHKTFHVPLKQLKDLEPGPKSPNYPEDCLIHGNLMYRLGIFGKQVAGVYLSACRRIKVSHNTICLVPRAAICINDGCWGGHIIEFNDAFLTVLETSDHGPFNAWGRDRFWQSSHREGRPCDMSLSRKYARLDNHLTTVIRNNRFADDGFSWGIDLDDGASNYLVENNLTLGCSIKLREGYFRTVRNNIFIGRNPPNKHKCFDGSDDVYAGNIYLNTDNHWALNRGPATEVLPIEMDQNVYFNTVGKPPLFGFARRLADGRRVKRVSFPFADWQALGVDAHSVIADPLFLDSGRGDFRLRKDSPALKLGFKEFPLDQFGVRNKVFQSILRDLGLRDQVGEAEDELFTWMGATIRNAPGGILFADVPASSEAFRVGFRSSDVLQQLNRSPVPSVDALIGAVSSAPSARTEFLILRAGQKRILAAAKPGGVPSKR